MGRCYKIRVKMKTEMAFSDNFYFNNTVKMLNVKQFKVLDIKH